MSKVSAKGKRIIWRTLQHVGLLVCSLFIGTLAQGWARHCDPAGGSGRAKSTARRVTTAVVWQGTRVALLIKSCHSHFPLINKHLLPCFIYTLSSDPWPRERRRPQTPRCQETENNFKSKSTKPQVPRGIFLLRKWLHRCDRWGGAVSVFICVRHHLFFMWLILLDYLKHCVFYK